MPETDQPSGAGRRGADRRSGIHTGFSLGRTALTGWALAGVVALTGFGTAPGTTAVPVAEATPLGGIGSGIGTVFGGPAAAGGILPVLPMDTVTAPSMDTVTAPSMDTVTAASVPTPAAGAPTGAIAAPGAGAPDLAVGGTTPGVAVPAGPAAQLRQAAFTSAAPDQRASLAISTALAQLGLPYVWGGDGPTNGDAGFDCSGLTTFSYGSAGVLLPRTAHTQYNAGPHVPGSAALQPGDLVFYGTPGRVHHVGLYLGAGRMINAPTFGRPVQVAFYRYRGDDYLGATRPAAAGGLTTGVLPYADPVPFVPDVALAPPARQRQAQERVFSAPTASLPAVLPQPGAAVLPSEQQSAAQSIAESDAAAKASGVPAVPAVVPRSFVGPVAVDPSAGDPSAGDPSAGDPSAGDPSAADLPAGSGGGSDPVAGTTTASSAPASTSAAEPGKAATPPGTSAPAQVPSAPAGTTAGTTTATAAPPAPPVRSSVAGQPPTTDSPATPSSAPAVVEKTSGSTAATTTLAPTSTVRTTAPKPTTGTAAKPVVPKSSTAPPAAKSVTTPATVTTKPAKTEDDPTTTTTSAGKTSKTKTTEEKPAEEKTSKQKSSSSDDG